MQIKVDENLAPDLKRLADQNRRSRTAEANIAIQRHLINKPNQPRVDSVRTPDRRSTRKEG